MRYSLNSVQKHLLTFSTILNNSLHAWNFLNYLCHLLIFFKNWLTLWWYSWFFFLKKLILKKISRRQNSIQNYPAGKELKPFKHTPGRGQSKRLSTIDELGSKIVRNRVFNWHLSPHWRQMAIKNTVSIDCRLPGVKQVQLQSAVQSSLQYDIT